MSGYDRKCADSEPLSLQDIPPHSSTWRADSGAKRRTKWARLEWHALQQKVQQARINHASSALTRSGRGSGRAPNVAREATCGALRYFVASRTTHVGGAAVSGLRCLIGSLRACTSGMNPFRALPDDAPATIPAPPPSEALCSHSGPIASIRTCVVCGKPIKGRAEKRSCSGRCRRVASRKGIGQ